MVNKLFKYFSTRLSIGDKMDVKYLVREIEILPNVQKISAGKLEKLAKKYGRKTEFKNYNFSTSVRHRSANLTVIIGSERVRQKNLNERQKEILRNLDKTLERVKSYLKKVPVVMVERRMGQNDIFSPKCVLFTSVYKEEFVRLPFMFSVSYFDPRGHTQDTLYTIAIPEWKEEDRQILVFPEDGITFILGSDYYGEIKKSFLRMGMWAAKQKGMLGIHAGAKIIRAKDIYGAVRRYGMLLFGLTATGKTTHTCHNHGLDKPGEGVEIVQDDVVFWRKDGSALGTEKGFFIKTDGLDSEAQRLLREAATKKGAVFENVMVDYRGRVHFSDDTLTGNGRGVIQRDDLGKYKHKTVDIPPLNELDGLIILFITRRNTILPIISKLTPEQAAAAFMLGESVESSGGDPRRAGESVRVVGTNPFIIGDFAEEGNRFYEFVKANGQKIQCYLMNTGAVGEIMVKKKDGTKEIRQKGEKIKIEDNAAIIRAIARGTIEWKKDNYFNVLVPARVDDMDITRFDIRKYYTKDMIKKLVNDLIKERKDYIRKFKKLRKEIVKSF